MDVQLLFKHNEHFLTKGWQNILFQYSNRKPNWATKVKVSVGDYSTLIFWGETAAYLKLIVALSSARNSKDNYEFLPLVAHISDFGCPHF